MENEIEKKIEWNNGAEIGEEGKLRRSIKGPNYNQNLEAFLNSWPDIGALGPTEA